MPFVCISFFSTPQIIIYIISLITSLPSRRGRVLVFQSEDNNVSLVSNMLQFINTSTDIILF